MHNQNAPMATNATTLKNSYSEGTANLFIWLKIAVVFGLVVALYFQVFPDLASDWWNDSAFSYGMLIPPIAGYVAYLRREHTLALPAIPDWRGLGLTVAACLMFLVGKLAAEFYLQRISFVFLLAGLIWTFWGRRRVGTLSFPLVLLATMVPLPALVYNAAAAPLQLLSSTVATRLAQALGVTVYQDGNIIHLANASLGVAEACSGLHSLSALVVGSLLLGFLEGASVWRWALLSVISVPLAIVVNVVRVTGTALLADYRMELAMGFYHALSGWLVFLMGFGMLWLIGKLLFRENYSHK